MGKEYMQIVPRISPQRARKPDIRIPVPASTMKVSPEAQTHFDVRCVSTYMMYDVFPPTFRWSAPGLEQIRASPRRLFPLPECAAAMVRYYPSASLPTVPFARWKTLSQAG